MVGRGSPAHGHGASPAGALNGSKSGTAPAARNFWLWGTWGKRTIASPFLTQKVPGKLQDVIIGPHFIIALDEAGSLMSWGEDKAGCLGLGTDATQVPECKTIKFPQMGNRDGKPPKIISVQCGRHHVVALTEDGQVFTWGDNSGGQLGLGDYQPRFEPAWVEDLHNDFITQILAVDNMTFALDGKGMVHAWGDNKDGALGLEHESPKVPRPEPLSKVYSDDAPIKKLAVKECVTINNKVTKILVGFVEYVDSAGVTHDGGIRPLGFPSQSEEKPSETHLQGDQELFEGIDLMRRIMDRLKTEWDTVVGMKHGGPYSIQDPADLPADRNSWTAEQLDRCADLDTLKEAELQLSTFIDATRDQLEEVSDRNNGTRNIKCVLSVFIDACRLRREKIRNTVVTRELESMKREQDVFATAANKTTGPDERITKAQEALSSGIQKVRDKEATNITAKTIQKMMLEAMELKLQLYEMQQKLLPKMRIEAKDMIAPALRTVKEKWYALRKTSVYAIYQDFQSRKQVDSDEELLALIAAESDRRVDLIIQQDSDKLISRDLLVPAVCYDLLLENAELRKMCNTYQIRVMLHHDKGMSHR
mmetsp:Transcript_89446/g.186878  ORF Transcript_89446/g.186878 Transcript_89446/m.186878 type:complete len:591 (+) Transcript_89446:328-2100(+)